VDATAFLTAHAVPLTLLVLFAAAWAWVKGLIEPRHYAAIMGATFAVLAYLAALEGQPVAAVWYAAVAAYQGVLYNRRRPRPLDGSHEAL
jgi:hypothetical protein